MKSHQSRRVKSRQRSHQKSHRKGAKGSKALREMVKRFRADGIIKRHPDGFGFFIPSDPSQSDAYVPRQAMKGLMSNDSVQAEVFSDRRKTHYCAEILRLLERAFTQVSGPIFRLNESQGLIRDERAAWGEDLHVHWDGEVEFEDGDWVLVQIHSYPGETKGFQGVLKEVIGDVGNPINDNLRVLATHQIPFEFSLEALEEAQRWPVEVGEEEKKRRVDLRDKGFVTIDGQTAKDFDDAIYVEMGRSGFHLWVAIADVSYYVERRSAIDREAYERGTSTYFPNFCNPMLPGALSNELCSLKPREDRLVMVAEMEFDFRGEMRKSKFYEAVICSQARVIYGQAQQILESHPPKGLKGVAQMIRRAADLAKILMYKRLKEGSLNLDIPETEVQVDGAGVVQDVLRAERVFAHKLIEELMLAANVAVARFLKKKDVPILYRTHAPPEPSSIDQLEAHLEKLGFPCHLQGGKFQKKIASALKEFVGTPRESILNILILRAMNQAQYTEENRGHFGLSFEDYTHFTSPIRRYPDLIIHRILKAVLSAGKGGKLLPRTELVTAATWLSACEQRAVKAERQLLAIKKARFMKSYIGCDFDGFISSVAKFGVFVTLQAFDVDGLVRVEDLPGEHYQFDEENLCFVGCVTGVSYCLGDVVQVRVVAVDCEAGKIDFVPIPSVWGSKKKDGLGEREDRAEKFQKKRPASQKRGKTAKNRQGLRSARVSKLRSKN